jgi:hypothetical protein
MPTRQGTLDQMPASGPSPAVRKPPLGGLQLQTDKLGTVPPIGLSPTTPGAARVASASGERQGAFHLSNIHPSTFKNTPF